MIVQPNSLETKIKWNSRTYNDWYCYLLVCSYDKTKRYIGISRNLKQRLRQHRNGLCFHTKEFVKPTYQKYWFVGNYSECAKFEHWLHTLSARWLNKNLAAKDTLEYFKRRVLPNMTWEPDVNKF